MVERGHVEHEEDRLEEPCRRGSYNKVDGPKEDDLVHESESDDGKWTIVPEGGNHGFLCLLWVNQVRGREQF